MPRQHVTSVTLKDCDVQTFKAGGKGGQNQNKTDSGVRIIHPPSGARGESREERSQLQNKRKAFTRMAETQEFKDWVRMECARQTGQEAEISHRVERSLQPKNLVIEGKDDKGRWVEID